MNDDRKDLEQAENLFEEFDTAGDKIVLPVLEESVNIAKEVVETGRVNVFKTVNESIESFEVPLSEEKIVVERIPKNEFVDVIPAASRYEGNVMIVPVLKEVAVVEKRIMLVEEIHISTLRTEKTETLEVTVRKEEINVSRTNL